MARNTLHGTYTTGCHDAINWCIEDIRSKTGWNRLERGTVNVALDNPYGLRQPADFCLPRNERQDHRPEDLTFELCRVVVVRIGKRCER
jgi:hypothetical protein